MAITNKKKKKEKHKRIGLIASVKNIYHSQKSYITNSFEKQKEFYASDTNTYLEEQKRRDKQFFRESIKGIIIVVVIILFLILINSI